MQQHVHDQTGRVIGVPKVPIRIISLVPSQTELLFDLGLENKIVGVTKFCIHPKDKAREKVIVGGTKKLHLDRIGHLKPDLIIANKEENNKEDIKALAQQFPVWISNVITLEDAKNMIMTIGQMTGTTLKAQQIISEIKTAFDYITTLPPLKVAYLIWRKPFMAAGKSTFINSLLEASGLKNAIKEERYPEVTDLQKLDADLIMLSSEPYPFTRKHIPEIQHLAPDKAVILVDGELFSWYGSRLRLFPSYVNSIATDFRSSQK